MVAAGRRRRRSRRGSTIIIYRSCHNVTKGRSLLDGDVINLYIVRLRRRRSASGDRDRDRDKNGGTPGGRRSSASGAAVGVEWPLLDGDVVVGISRMRLRVGVFIVVFIEVFIVLIRIGVVRYLISAWEA